MFWKSYPKKYLCTHSLESKAPFGWDENKKDGKKGEENREENTIFPYLVQERKQEGNKIMKKKITLGPQIFKACLETHKTEWYHSVLVTHDPKLMGPTNEFLFGWVLSHGCEWPKLKTGFTCFQNSKTEFQWQVGKLDEIVGPKVRHCHIPPITLSFLFFFSFFLYSLLIFLSLFLCIYSSFCSSSEQKAHTHRPLTWSLTRRPTPVTHTPTTQCRHANPSREIIDVDLWSHAEKIHHAIILLIAAIVLVLRSGCSVEIGIHSNGGSPLETIGNDSI